MPIHRSPDPAPLPSVALTLEELQIPSPDDAARLLQAAGRLWKLKPWEQIEEDDLFIVQNPDDGQLGFVSVLGTLGEQFGVVVYRGAGTYFQLLDFIDRSDELPPLPAIPEDPSQMPDMSEVMALMAQLQEAEFDPMELLRLSQLQLMFEPRRDLETYDKEWIKAHKYKATGRGFPTFRSLVPGYLPWRVEAGEAAFLAAVLEQLIEVLERPNFTSDLLQIRESGRGKPIHELFARVPKTASKGENTWSDQRLKVTPDQTFLVDISPDEADIERIAALPEKHETLEIELVNMPLPVGGEVERPCFPSLLLWGRNNQVGGIETIACGPGPYRLPLLTKAIVSLLAARETRPAKIQFASPELELLEDLGAMLNIEVEEVDDLPTLDPAVEKLLQHFSSDTPFADMLNELGDDDKPRVLH